MFVLKVTGRVVKKGGDYLNSRLKSFLSGLVGVLVAIMIVSIIRNGQIDWDEIGFLLTATFLVLFIRLGLNLYKKNE